MCMKKTQIKDALKNIQKRKVSFFSIVVIAAMAVASFLGMNFASRAIRTNADRFYDSVNFRDAEVISTLLLTPEDIEVIRNIDGVSDVEALWQCPGLLVKGEQNHKATVISLTSRINTPMILSGRLPQSVDECLVDKNLAEHLSVSVGDDVRITGAEYLTVEQFKVCGIILSADYAATEMAVPGNREVVVQREAFDTESLSDCSMKALVRFDKADGLNRFYDAYYEATERPKELIEAIADTQAVQRTEFIKNEYASGIAEGEQKLANAGIELEDARRELDDGYKELADGEKKAEEAAAELENGAKELDDALSELEDGKARLLSGEEELQKAGLELEDARRQLDEGEIELNNAGKELSKGRNKLDAGWKEYYENVNLLADAKIQLEDGRKQLDDGAKQLHEPGNL